MTITLSLSDVEELTLRALGACNTSDANARSVAASVVASEADGIHSHGLARLPTYCEHARCGKIDGQAVPEMEEVAAAGLKVDARDGFAHPAIDLGLPALTALAKAKGLAAMAVTNSYNCGVCGYHVERIAEAGLIALGYVNAPASIAPWGGKQAVFGTNPMSFAVPRPGAPPLVIDQSSSVIARSEVIIHADTGEAIPEGWALDKAGKPTTDPKAALARGTMVPSGQYKGASLALIVEVMAAALTGSSLSIQASSFADNAGGSPRTGQFFIAIDPLPFAGAGFAAGIEQLLLAMTDQEGVRLPGDRRRANRTSAAQEGITIREALHERLLGYCNG